MRQQIGWVALWLLGAGGALGCGSDSTPSGGSGGAAGAVGGGGAPTSGSGGSSTAGAAGAAGAGGGAPAPVPCGSKTCPAPPPPIPGLPGAVACCADMATNACGWANAMGVCTASPPVDSRCPMVTGPLGSLMPCCTSALTCGADTSVLGTGCTDLGNMLFRIAYPMAPPPVNCDGTPVPSAGGASGSG